MEKAAELFGTTVAFDEILQCIKYTKERTDGKKYVEDIDILTNSVCNHYRKCFHSRKHGTGILIGQTYRDEGQYWSGDTDSPGYLTISKRIPFWVVATGVNKTVLVPKDSGLTVIISGLPCFEDHKINTI